jgi:hypothetical protein
MNLFVFESRDSLLKKSFGTCMGHQRVDLGDQDAGIKGQMTARLEILLSREYSGEIMTSLSRLIVSTVECLFCLLTTLRENLSLCDRASSFHYQIQISQE